MDKTSFVVHCDWVDSMKDLPAETCKGLFIAMSEYTRTGELPEIEDPVVKALFSFIFKRMKDARVKYEQECQRNQERAKNAANARWNARECSEHENDATSIREHKSDAKPCLECHDNDYDNDYDNDNDNNDNEYDNDLKKEKINKKEKPKAVRFVPPTLEEVQAYCREKNLSINCEDFLDYYQSNGWMVGKNKMKNWQATINRWSRNNKSPPKSNAEQIDDYILDVINSRDEKGFLKML